MKLYTEEQVKSICYAMIDYAIECGQELDTVIDKRLESTISIVLPSDEEIENVATHLEPSVTRRAFQSGAKWMKNKIQEGNKLHYLWDKFL